MSRDEKKKQLPEGDVETNFCHGSKVKGHCVVLMFLSEVNRKSNKTLVDSHQTTKF